MTQTFTDRGMSKTRIYAGIDNSEIHDFQQRILSRTTYLIDPRTNLPWDLKEILRAAADIAKIQLYEHFTTTRYEKDILQLGFDIVKFSEKRPRKLGYRGYDPSEFADDHTLYLSDGSEIANGMARKALQNDITEDTVIGYETRFARWHLRYERRTVNSQRVKNQRGLTCEACHLDGKKAFGRDYAMSAMEAHHLSPVALIAEEEIRPARIKDFLVLCACCHRLIHRLKRPDDIEGLRRLVHGKTERGLGYAQR